MAAMMKRYDEYILHKLLDKYENSSLYRGDNKKQVSISFPIDRKTLPEYFDETSVAYDVIHEQLLQAEENGYLRLIWKKRQGHILEKCVLVPEKVEDIYALLGRRSRHEKMQDLLRIASEYTGENEILDAFLTWIRERIAAGKSIRAFADEGELGRFEDLCRLIAAIEQNKTKGDCFLRQLSIRTFHDSKTAEALLGKAVIVLEQFGAAGSQNADTIEESAGGHEQITDTVTESAGGHEQITDTVTESIIGGHPRESEICERELQENDRFNNADELLAEYNIYRNPTWTMFKGTGRFSADGKQWTDLQRFVGGLGLSGGQIPFLTWDPKLVPVRVVTIENLTSFHQWVQLDGTLVIYIGGFVHKAAVHMLRSLYQTYPETQYLHFGDIDCGGFAIWKNLCQRTGIPFQTTRMDKDTLEQYRVYGKPLTSHDRSRLRQMITDPFFAEQTELFETMLRKNRKLEQECVTE